MAHHPGRRAGGLDKEVAMNDQLHNQICQDLWDYTSEDGRCMNTETWFLDGSIKVVSKWPEHPHVWAVQHTLIDTSRVFLYNTKDREILEEIKIVSENKNDSFFADSIGWALPEWALPEKAAPIPPVYPTALQLSLRDRLNQAVTIASISSGDLVQICKSDDLPYQDLLDHAHDLVQAASRIITIASELKIGKMMKTNKED